MALWIPITIFAAFVQNLRFMLQKHLKATRLSSAGATFARSVFAAPMALVVLAALLLATGQGLPRPDLRFAGFAALGAVAQLLATVAMVALFGERNFATGITFKKTEVLLAALAGWVILGEAIAQSGWVAILIGFAGLVLLSAPPGEALARLSSIRNRASFLGLSAGLLFAISAVSFRGALISLDGSLLIIRVVLAVFCVTALQSLILGLWLGLREAGEIGRVFRHWRITSLVGLTSVLGTIAWFAAFSLQTAAYVKALGQIELLFSFIAGAFWFRERHSRRELLAMGLIVASILLLILLH